MRFAQVKEEAVTLGHAGGESPDTQQSCGLFVPGERLGRWPRHGAKPAAGLLPRTGCSRPRRLDSSLRWNDGLAYFSTLPPADVHSAADFLLFQP